MKDIKDFIKVADLYAQDSLTENKKIEEGLGDWLMDKLGFGMPEAEAVVDAAKAEAETLDIDPAVVDTTEIVGSASTDTTGTTDTTADSNQAIRLLKKYGTKSKQSVILCHKVQNV